MTIMHRVKENEMKKIREELMKQGDLAGVILGKIFCY